MQVSEQSDNNKYFKTNIIRKQKNEFPKQHKII